MKYEVQISRLAVVCVLCTWAISGALGAASVRSLGGAGTITGTASAASGGTSGGAVSAARAGSLRVTPSAGSGSSASSSAAKGTTTTGRVATSPRLSIGKYLGGGTSVSGGSSIKNQKPGSTSVSGGNSGGSMNPGVAAELEGRVGELEARVDGMYEKGDIDAVLSDKQNVLTPVDDYIVIDKDEIYLDVDALQENLDAVAGKDGREVEIGSNTTHLLWRYKDEPVWQELIALSAITGAPGADGAVGPQGPAGEKGEKGDKGDPGEGLNSDLYPTKEFMNSEIAKAISNATTNYVTVAEMGAALDGKADAGTSYTKTESDAKYLTEHQSLADYAKTADVASKYATKDELDEAVIEAGNIDLSSYAKTADVNAKLAGKADAGSSYTKTESDAKYLTEHQSLAGYAKTADVASKQDIDDLTEYVGLVEDGVDAKVAGRASQKDLDTLIEYVANDMYSKTNADNKFATKDEVKNMASADDVLDVMETLDTKLDKAALPKVVSAFENDAKYVTESDVATATAGLATTEALQAGLASKANAADVYTKTEVDEKVANVIAGDMDEALKSYAKTEYVDAELAKKANSDDLGALAKKDLISNADVADDAAIAKEKLATDVQASLAKADQAVTTADAPTDGDYVLAVSNGQKGWFEVVTTLE